MIYYGVFTNGNMDYPVAMFLDEEFAYGWANKFHEGNFKIEACDMAAKGGTCRF